MSNTVFTIIIVGTCGITLIYLFYSLSKIFKEFSSFNSKNIKISYDEISNKLLHNNNNNFKVLSKLFKEFNNTTLTKNVNGEMIRYSTIEAEYIFNEENVLFKNMHYKTVSFMPQVLTGIGIFGTFLGITSGLKPLGEQLGEVDKFQEAIGSLLAGVSISFNTSLWGIGTSIFLSLIIKIAFDMCLKEINKFIDIIEFDLIKANEYDILLSMERQITSQNEVLQNVNINIESSVKKIFLPSLEQIVSNIIDIKDTQQGNAENFASEMINRFEENLNTHIEEIEQRFKLIIDKSDKFVTNFDSSINSFEKLSEAQKDILEEVVVILEDVNKSNNAINKLHISFKELFEASEKITKENTETANSVEATINMLAKCTEKQSALYDGVDKIIKNSCLINEKQNDNIEKIDIISKEILDNFSSVNSNIREYTEHFEEIKNKNIQINNSLTSNYEKVADTFDGVSRNLNLSIKNIDSNFIDKFKSMNDKSSDLLIKYEKISESIIILADKLDHFSKTEEATHRIWAEYKNTFISIADSIAVGVAEYNKEIEKGTVEIFKGYDLEISKALGYLKETTQEFIQIDETFEALNNNFEGLNSNLGNIVKLLDNKIGGK